MTYVALAEAFALLAAIAAFTNLLRAQQRSHTRHEDALIDRLLHATGNTWTPPPSEPRAEPDPPEPRGYQPAPEQYQP